jgi:lipoyl(octanoyl) transferase
MSEVKAAQSKRTEFIDLGLLGYEQAWSFQEDKFAQTVATKVHNRTAECPVATPNYLIFCQHPHVYTIGKSGKPEHLLLDEDGLEQVGASYHKINRGGDITYHGPGQLVGYPILDLDNFFTDIHIYLRTIEQAIINTCADYGLNAGRIDGLTGVWIEDRKICAIGVRASRWVTMHGFAFNINTDLNYFGNIIPCGIDDKAVTSLAAELGAVQDFAAVSYKVLGHIVALFEMDLVME